MGGFLGGLFGGSKGSAKTDRTNQLAAFSDLNNVFNFALPMAGSEQKRGDVNVDSAINSLGLSSDYYKKILSGDRAKIAQAVEPTTNAINAEADAGKRNLEATGTARGGGTAAASQQIEDKKRAATDQVIAQAIPDAVRGNTDVASRVAGIGQSQLQAALSALGIGEGAASSLGNLSGDAFKFDTKRQEDIGSSIANLAITALGFI